MKVVVAPNAFKGTLSAETAAQAIGAGIRTARPDAEIILLPVADGGDGTLDILCNHAGFERINCRVTGPLGDPTPSAFGYKRHERHACIETALACGLAQVSPQARTPLATTTYGVGELVAAALAQGATTLTLGIGGTATVEGGLGLAQALGATFSAPDGSAVHLPLSGGDLTHIDSWNLQALTTLRVRAKWQVLCDVRNPLCGPQGAAAVFGPQKGATPAVVTVLDDALGRIYGGFARDTGRDVRTLPSAGAGGGLGAFALQFLCDTLTPGSDAFLDLLDLDAHLRGATHVITGEGCLDAPSLTGKVPGAVLARGHAAGVPVVAMVGSTQLPTAEARRVGFAAVISCEAGPSPEENLRHIAEAWARNLSA